jgi:hypothetical protein
MNDYYAKNGEYTLTNIPNVPFPFGLYHKNQNIGHYATQKEALAKHKELTK